MDKKRLKSHSPGSRSNKRIRSNDDDDLSDDDSHLLESTSTTSGSTIDSQILKTYDNEAEVGIIESVDLKNFMCHNRLQFKFGPRINFIIGNNGSGKSAVLSSIVIGLGGKAQATSRGSSVKGFIKNGKTWAEVSIKLRNTGTDSFDYERYGKMITVERRFQSDNTGGYKLKSERGEVISTKRDDVMRLLDRFNIQVDNPICILNQEVSRNFLHSRSPQDKYKFFLKATQLAKMEEDYDASDEQQRLMTAFLEAKESELPEMKKLVTQAEKKYMRHQGMDQMREKLGNLQNEIAWAQVKELENELKNREKKLEQERSRTGKFQEKVDKWQKEYTDKTEEVRITQEKFEAINAKLDEYSKNVDELKQNLGQEKKKLTTVVIEDRQLQSQLRSSEADRVELVKRMDELRQTINNQTYQQEREMRMQTIKEKEEQKADLEAQRRTTQQHTDILRGAVDQYKREANDSRQEIRSLEGHLRSKNAELANTEASQTNQLRRFGKWTPALVEKIEHAHRQGRFHRKPFGPLGTHIKVIDKKWSLAVESCIRGFLQSYLCNDRHDSAILEGLMRSVDMSGARKPNIVILRFTDKIYDYRQHQARSNFQTLVEALDIDHPMVANYLMHQRGVEHVLLIEHEQDARDTMRSPRIDRSCREAYTCSGDHLYAYPNYRYYSAEIDRVRFLQESMADFVTGIKEEIEGIRKQQREADQKLKEKNTQLNQTQNEVRRYDQMLTKLRQDVNKLNAEITELKNHEDVEPMDVTTLEEDLRLLTERIAELKEKRKETKERAAAQKEIVEEKQKLYNDRETKVHDILTNQIDPFREEFEAEKSKLTEAHSQLKHYENVKKEHLKGISEYEKKCEEMEKKVSDQTKIAIELCPERKNTRRDLSSIVSEIQHINRKLDEEEVMHGNRGEVTKRYMELKLDYEKMLSQVNKVKTLKKNLQAVMVKRHKNYNNFRRWISIRVRSLFHFHIESRGFSGDLRFNHDRQSLDVMVKPASQHVTTLKGLSGGEKSFSTVCFILALWEAVESPFRILDEFDVFMDMVTRRMSMDMMMNAAMAKTYNQFIFLTPQGLTSLKEHNPAVVKVFRMNDPDRNQRTLPFGESEDTEQQ